MKVFVVVVVALALIAIGVEASEPEFTSECTYEKYRNNECMIVLRSDAEPRYVNSVETIILNIVFLFCLFLGYVIFKLCKVLLMLLGKAEQVLSK